MQELLLAVEPESLCLCCMVPKVARWATYKFEAVVKEGAPEHIKNMYQSQAEFWLNALLAVLEGHGGSDVSDMKVWRKIGKLAQREMDHAACKAGGQDGLARFHALPAARRRRFRRVAAALEEARVWYKIYTAAMEAAQSVVRKYLRPAAP